MEQTKPKLTGTAPVGVVLRRDADHIRSLLERELEVRYRMALDEPRPSHTDAPLAKVTPHQWTHFGHAAAFGWALTVAGLFKLGR